jgi:hypothetical protein
VEQLIKLHTKVTEEDPDKVINKNYKRRGQDAVISTLSLKVLAEIIKLQWALND